MANARAQTSATAPRAAGADASVVKSAGRALQISLLDEMDGLTVRIPDAQGF